MKKFHKNYELCLELFYECLSESGEILIITVNHKIHLETLIAMGLNLQKDLYNDLISQLDNIYENTSNIIGITDFYCKLGFTYSTTNPKHLPLSLTSNEDKMYILVENSMFIPEFRMNL